MHISAKLVLLGGWVAFVPISTLPSVADTPEIALQGTCHNGSVIMMVNHPPKIPILADKSAKSELAYWNEIKNSEDASLFLVYITNFQNGMFLEAAIDKYKRDCGDLTALPAEVLVCVPGSAPVVKPPPHKKPPIIIPPPPPPPVVSLPPPPKHRPRPVVQKCGGSNFALSIKCNNIDPGTDPGWGSGHSPNNPPPTGRNFNSGTSVPGKP